MIKTINPSRLRHLAKVDLNTHSQIVSKQNLEDTFILKITNHQTRYQLHFGGQFKHLFEARDQVLEHPFTFTYRLHNQNYFKNGESFLKSQLFGEIKKNTKKFIVESISNVVSTGFNFLLKKDLEDKQSAEFTSKNIMINVQTIYQKSVVAIQENPVIHDSVNIEQVKMQLLLETENILDNVLINLADNYPQAPASGGTLRMRDVINEVNRVEDEENDFILTSGINIFDYLEPSKTKGYPHLLEPRADGCYTTFIMRVINAAIEVSQDNSKDFRERTIFQKFTEFNQHLLGMTQQKEYQQLMTNLQRVDMKAVNQEQVNTICSKFNSILSNEQLNEIRQKEEEIKPNSNSYSGQLSKQFNALWQRVVQKVSEMKKNKQFALGQKIPAAVKAFNRQEVQAQQFTVKHSSIIRILTKWAGYLEETFKKAQKMVRQRKYPFKDSKNRLLNIAQGGDGEEKLIKQLGVEYQEVKKKFKNLLMRNYEMMGKFLSQSQPSEFISSVNRYSETRMDSSKINAVLASLLLQYVNILIHHLLKAGHKIQLDQERYGSKRHNLNLVVFRVSDLMRSKLQCTEGGFISLLKTMYLLENSEAMQGKFKLVRIKNKLDDPANNIMINYLFMGKVQCELQLSIQEVKGKEKDYYAFSHFVYQLTRGMFGSIAECAIMISQLDPMIAASKGSYYQEKQQRSNLLKELRENPPEIGKEQQADAFFQCKNCQKFTLNQHVSKFLPQNLNKVCYQCISSAKDLEQSVEQSLQQILGEMQVKPIKNYQGLKKLRKQKYMEYMVQVTSGGEIKLMLIVHLKEEMKTFTVELNSRVLDRIGSPGFDFAQMDYVDISSRLGGQTKAKELAYLFQTAENLPEKIFQLVSLNKDNFKEKVKVLLTEFIAFRREKNAIKSIKFKAQIIKTSPQEFKALDKVCRKLVLRQDNKELPPLRYVRYRHLQLTNIRQITSNWSGITSIRITSIPKWMRQCQNMNSLNLQNNRICRIEREELPDSLTQLILKENALESIDITNLENLLSLDLRVNKLTNIDIEKNNSLRLLKLDENKFTNFNLGTNTSLNTLTLSENQITSFDMGENIYLKALQLNCNQLTSFSMGNNNSLISLDVSMNKLTNFDLGGNNSLTSLDVSQNKLTSFSMETNSSLTYLDANENRLMSFYLSQNNSLTSLQLFQNQLSSLDIGNSSRLTQLQICQNKFTSFDMGKNNSLTFLDISTNRLTSFSMGENNSLNSLDLNSNKLISFDMGGNNCLIQLYLLQNNLTEVTLGSNKCLSKLTINNNPRLKILPDLPVSLEELDADRHHSINYDFKSLINLKELLICGQTTCEELKNFLPQTNLSIE